jgi:hypothetical protein
VAIGLDAVLMKSIPIFLPIKRPSLISFTLTPDSIIFLPYFMISPIKSVDVVVPSPANLLVALTDFLIRVHTASLRRSS